LGTGYLDAHEKIIVKQIEEREGEVGVLTEGKRKEHWVSEDALREACIKMPIGELKSTPSSLRDMLQKGILFCGIKFEVEPDAKEAQCEVCGQDMFVYEDGPTEADGRLTLMTSQLGHSGVPSSSIAAEQSSHQAETLRYPGPPRKDWQACTCAEPPHTGQSKFLLEGVKPASILSMYDTKLFFILLPPRPLPLALILPPPE
jgi:hypothetical protein